MNKTEEELVEENLKSERLLNDWQIPQYKRHERIALVFYIVFIAATLVGTLAYLFLDNPVLVNAKVSGFAIVLALALACIGLRYAQVGRLKKDLVEFAQILEKNFTGEPQADVAMQEKIEEKYQWASKRMNAAGYMIIIAMAIISTLNMQQGGMQDLNRSMVFAGAFGIFATGYIWFMCKFNIEVLSCELRERTKAAVHFQHTNMRQEALEDASTKEEDEF